MKRIAILPLILPLLFGSNSAQSAGRYMNDRDMKSMDMKIHHATTNAVGVVKQVNQTKGIAVITHEPIKSLGWSAMAMDFTVENKALFNKLIVGKKVHFEFVTRGDQYVVTRVK